jgi:hypothetical protein
MRLFKRRLNVGKFTARWQEVQQFCASRKTWPTAIIQADNLVNEALKKRKYKGKTQGERLVAAQRDLTANDKIWLGHKLRNKLEQEQVDVRKLKKDDMLTALSGFRQALRDLGALKKNGDDQ